MRYWIVILCFLIIGCEDSYDGSNSLKTLNHGDCCTLLDEMSGNPSSGGCWYFVSAPSGSSVDQSSVDGSDNPSVCLDECGEYVFEYSAICCPECQKATLTVNHCDGCNGLTVTITGQCNN